MDLWIRRQHDSLRQRQTRQALRILEHFAGAARITFDRLQAGRILGEAERAIAGSDAQSWAHRLVEIGESFDLRIRTVECRVREALAFVGQGVPVAAAYQLEDGEEHWLLMAEARGRRVRLLAVEDEEHDCWVSIRALVRKLGLRNVNDSTRWVIGQPALPCETAPASHGTSEGHEHLQPLARLLALMRPEWKDLWVILVFASMVGVLALATPIAVEALVNTVAFGRFLQPVIVLSILLFTFLAFAAAMRGLVTWIVEIMQRRFFVRVVEDLAYRLPRVATEAFDREYGPEAVNRFFDVVTVQKVLAALLLDGLAIVLGAIVGMAVLAFYHPFLLGFDVVLLLLIAFIVFVLGRGAVRSSIDESRAKYAIADWLEELTRQPTAFKLHSGYQFALDRADRLTVNYLEARKKHFRIVLRQVVFALGLQALAATVLLGLGGWLVIQRELTLGQLVAAELIVSNIVISFAKLGKHMESFYDLLASVDKLGHLFDLPIERHDRLFHLHEGVPARISLRGVSYAYAEQDAILQDVDFDLEPGDRIALVGPSGSGKSTCVDLLCGLRQPTSGHIELDGIDLRELRPDSLREHVSMVRGVEIFGGSIEENVHLNRPFLSARDVRDALESVGLLDELLRLPEGLNTPLQSGGRPLSDGQAARLMLARAIIGRPRLVIIDGTLDGLPDNLLDQVMAFLGDPDAPWSLVIATGRREVANRCGRRLALGEIRRSEQERFAGAGV